MSWKPSNPNIGSGRPLTELVGLFIFTSRDGKDNHPLDSAVVLGTIADTVGAWPDEIFPRVKSGIIAGTQAGTETARTGTLPPFEFLEGRIAMLNPDFALWMQTNQYHITARIVEDKGPIGEQVHDLILLIYRK
jgi:hypothetical protein